MLLIKNIFLLTNVAMMTENCLFPISIVKETNSFVKWYNLSIQNINEKIDSNRQSILKKNCHKAVSCAPLLASQTLVSGSKIHQNVLFFISAAIYNHAAYQLVDVTYILICFIFHKSPWWPGWTFCVQTSLNFRVKLLKIKVRKKYFVADQKFSKIFHGSSIYV